MRYLIIYEDGQVYKADHITDSDVDGFDNGVLTIVDISNSEYPKEMIGRHEWADLVHWNN